MSDRIAKFVTGLGLLELKHLIYPRCLIEFGLLHKVRSYGISGQIFGFIFFVSKRRLRVVMKGKSSREYPVNAGVLQGSILGLTLFLLYSNDLPDDVICNIAIYADDTTELESDLRDTIPQWCRKWPVDFNVGKTN